MFLVLLGSGDYIVVSVRLTFFAHNRQTSAPSPTQLGEMPSKRKKYVIDDRAENAAKLYLFCAGNPVVNLKIPSAMMARGYTPEEATCRALQMQVHHIAIKLGGGIPTDLLRHWPQLQRPSWLWCHLQRQRVDSLSSLSIRMLIPPPP